MAPVLAGFLLFAALSSLALPGFGQFSSANSWFCWVRFQIYPWVARRCHLGHRVYRGLCLAVLPTHGKPVLFPAAYAPGSAHPMTDVKAREVTALAPLVLLTIVLGVFPTPALDVHQSRAVEWTQQTLGVV